MSSNKSWTLEKREHELRRALVSGASKEATTRAAEHVRAAQLAILKKAESDSAPAEPRPENKSKELTKIQLERKKWLDLSVAEIISRVQA